ncbi:MAG TPA: heavy metal-associated domain-containing protein [Gemmatimonadales bacterium]|nr:heavy metal-associated domain-containing protein [Gemmatimonadales bacterium]
MLSTTLSVSGMTCGHCQQKVERALRGVTGVYGAEVDQVAGTAQVEAGDGVTLDMLIAAVERAGYRAAAAV